MTAIPYGPNGQLLAVVELPGSCGATCPCADSAVYGMHWAPGDVVFPPGEPASRRLLGEARMHAGLIGGGR